MKKVKILKLTWAAKVSVLLMMLLTTTCVFLTNNNHAIKAKAQVFTLEEYGSFNVSMIDGERTFIYESSDHILGVAEIKALNNLNDLGYNIYFIREYNALRPLDFKYRVLYEPSVKIEPEDIPYR